MTGKQNIQATQSFGKTASDYRNLRLLEEGSDAIGCR